MFFKIILLLLKFFNGQMASRQNGDGNLSVFDFPGTQFTNSPHKRDLSVIEMFFCTTPENQWHLLEGSNWDICLILVFTSIYSRYI
jgi:hypothetical protein